MRISAALALLVLATIGSAASTIPRKSTIPVKKGAPAPKDDDARMDRLCKGTCKYMKNSCGRKLGCGPNTVDVSKLCPVTCKGVKPKPAVASAPAPTCNVKTIHKYCIKNKLKETYSAGVSDCMNNKSLDREKKSCCVVGVWKGWVAEYKKGVLATPGCKKDSGIGQYIFNALDNRVAMVDTRVKKLGYNCDKGEDQKIEQAAEAKVAEIEKKTASTGPMDDDVTMDRLCKGTCKYMKRNCGQMLGCGPNKVDVSKLCPVTCKGVKPKKGAAPGPAFEDFAAFMDRHVTEVQAIEGEEEVSRTTDITIGICIGVTIGLVLYLASKLWNNFAAEKAPVAKYSEIETQEAATILSVDQPVYQTN